MKKKLLGYEIMLECNLGMLGDIEETEHQIIQIKENTIKKIKTTYEKYKSNFIAVDKPIDKGEIIIFPFRYVAKYNKDDTLFIPKEIDDELDYDNLEFFSDEINQYFQKIYLHKYKGKTYVEHDFFAGFMIKDINIINISGENKAFVKIYCLITNYRPYKPFGKFIEPFISYINGLHNCGIDVGKGIKPIMKPYKKVINAFKKIKISYIYADGPFKTEQVIKPLNIKEPIITRDLKTFILEKIGNKIELDSLELKGLGTDNIEFSVEGFHDSKDLVYYLLYKKDLDSNEKKDIIETIVSEFNKLK